MAISTQHQPTIVCDLESEKDTGWPEGTMVWVKESHIGYVLEGGVFYAIN